MKSVKMAGIVMLGFLLLVPFSVSHAEIQAGSASLISRGWGEGGGFDGFKFATQSVVPDGETGDFYVETNIIFLGSEVGVQDLGEGSIDTITEVPETDYSDSCGMELDHVYAFTLADATYAIIEFTEIATDIAPTGEYPYKSTFNYKYQPDSSRSFVTGTVAPEAMVGTTKYSDGHFELWFELKENLNSESQDYTSVSVTGGEITDSLTLEYYSDCDCWEEVDMLAVGDSVNLTDVYTFNYTVDSTSETLTATAGAVFESFATLQSPGNGATVENPVTLEWLAADGAIDYEVELQGPGDFDLFQETTGTSIQITETLSAGAYTWTVFAMGSNNAETVTDAWSFSVEVEGVLPGDLDSNTTVDLADAILALQVASDISNGSMVNINSDVNGDGKIGLAETIYILQKVAGLR